MLVSDRRVHWPYAPAMSWLALSISALALVVSALSFLHTRRAWKLMARPLIAVAVETEASGNIATMLNIVVENHGSRAAKLIRLRARRADLDELLRAPPGEPVREMVLRCFSDEATIPVLIPGQRRQNAFGFIAPGDAEATWKGPGTLDVVVTYKDLDTEEEFEQRMPIHIGENTSFARGTWAKST